jgi:outer membrane protein assembly factor BamB
MRKISCLFLVSALALAACERDRILEGTRFGLRGGIDASQPSESNPAPQPEPARGANLAQPIALPAARANADWTQRGGSPSHETLHGALSVRPALAWSVDIGAGTGKRNRITAAPVVAGGRVFAMDGASHVTAVTLAGQRLWSVDAADPADRSGGISGGALASDGARAYAVTGYGEIVALDAASGAVVWRQRLGASVSGAPLVAQGRVYVAADDGTAWAVDAATGKVAWTATGADQPSNMHRDGGAAPVLLGNTVVYPFASGLLLAVDPQGQVVWTAFATGQRLGRAYAQSGVITGDPVVAGGRIYAGTQAGRLGAWTTEGQMIWSVTEGAMNAPLVAGDSVFVVNDEAVLLRLSQADGATIWATDLPYFTKSKPKKQSAITASHGPVLAGGRLWVASSDGHLRGFSPMDGSLGADLALPGGAASVPALAQGMIFVVSQRGQLLAFR